MERAMTKSFSFCQAHKPKCNAAFFLGVHPYELRPRNLADLSIKGSKKFP